MAKKALTPKRRAISPALPSTFQLDFQILARLYQHAEFEIMTQLATQLQKGSPGSAWYTRRLGELDQVRRNVQAILGKAETEATRQAEYLIEQAALLGSAYAKEDLAALKAGDYVEPSRLFAQIARISADTVARLRRATPVALRKTMDTYQQVIAKHASAVVLGANTTREATTRAALELTDRGLRGFVDKAGREWKLDTYAEMAVRTGSQHAHVEAAKATYQAAGYRFMLVSAHGFTCNLCGPWAGRVVSIDNTPRGRVQVLSELADEMVTVECAGTLEEAREAGLHHPNCVHALTLYVPGASEDGAAFEYATSTPKGGYEASQKQRAIEREIRAAKLKAEIAPTLERKARVRTLQARMREHLKEHPELARHYEREQNRMRSAQAKRASKIAMNKLPEGYRGFWEGEDSDFLVRPSITENDWDTILFGKEKTRPNGRTVKVGGHLYGQDFLGKTEFPSTWTINDIKYAAKLTLTSPQARFRPGKNMVFRREVRGVIVNMEWMISSDGTAKLLHFYPLNGEGVTRNELVGKISKPFNQELLHILRI